MNDSQCFPRAAVSAIIVREGKILLVLRGHQPNKGLWSLPGGSIEPGETVREACAREVLEETSLTVEVGDFAAVQDVISRGPDERPQYHYVIINLRATVIAGELQAATDAADARWFDPEEVRMLDTTPGLLERLEAAGVLRADTARQD